MDAYTLLTRTSEKVFWFSDDGIVWGDNSNDQMLFNEIKYIRSFEQLGLSNGIKSAYACDVVPRTGKPLHFISRRGDLDRSAEFRKFDAELKQRADAYPQAELWSGMSKIVWATYALWFCCSAVVFAACGFFLILFAWALFFKDPSRPPVMGALFCGFIGLVTGYNLILLWQTLKEQWPRRQGAPEAGRHMWSWIARVLLFLVSSCICLFFALADIASSLQLVFRSTDAPSLFNALSFTAIAGVAALIARWSWKHLNRERISEGGSAALKMSD